MVTAAEASVLQLVASGSLPHSTPTLHLPCHLNFLKIVHKSSKKHKEARGSMKECNKGSLGRRLLST